MGSCFFGKDFLYQRELSKISARAKILLERRLLNLNQVHVLFEDYRSTVAKILRDDQLTEEGKNRFSLSLIQVYSPILSELVLKVESFSSQ